MATMVNYGQHWTTMGNNGQQCTTMCGATCISDAVFNLKFGLHKRTSWIDNTIEPSLTLQWPVSWLCHMCRRKEQRWGQNQQQQDLDDGSWMLGRTNRHYIGCYMWKDWYWILDVCKNKSSLYVCQRIDIWCYPSQHRFYWTLQQPWNPVNK